MWLIQVTQNVIIHPVFNVNIPLFVQGFILGNVWRFCWSYYENELKN